MCAVRKSAFVPESIETLDQRLEVGTVLVVSRVPEGEKKQLLLGLVQANFFRSTTKLLILVS